MLLGRRAAWGSVMAGSVPASESSTSSDSEGGRNLLLSLPALAARACVSRPQGECEGSEAHIALHAQGHERRLWQRSVTALERLALLGKAAA